jgi:hypothetical protein
MTPEQQKIAIAEACGWTKCEHFASINLTIGIPPANNPPKYGTYENGMAQLPDYCNDLNAMHEAEKTLSKDLRKQLVFFLMSVVIKDYDRNTPNIDKFRVLYFATAAQRAEAFSRTLNLRKP